MNACHERFEHIWLRPALFAAAIGMSGTLLLSVCSAFYIVSSEPVLVATTEARAAVAVCDALGDRVARQRCVQRLVASASAQDAGTSQLAAVASHQRGMGR